MSLPIPKGLADEKTNCRAARWHAYRGFLTTRLLPWARNRLSRAQLHGDSKYGRLLCLTLITCALAVGCLISTGRCLSSHRPCCGPLASQSAQQQHSDGRFGDSIELPYPQCGAFMVSYQQACAHEFGADVLDSLDTTDWFFSWPPMKNMLAYTFMHIWASNVRPYHLFHLFFMNPIFKGTLRDCFYSWHNVLPE
jgi:hypothetical protein